MQSTARQYRYGGGDRGQGEGGNSAQDRGDNTDQSGRGGNRVQEGGAESLIQAVLILCSPAALRPDSALPLPPAGRPLLQEGLARARDGPPGRGGTAQAGGARSCHTCRGGVGYGRWGTILAVEVLQKQVGPAPATAAGQPHTLCLPAFPSPPPPLPPTPPGDALCAAADQGPGAARPAPQDHTGHLLRHERATGETKGGKGGQWFLTT